LSSTLELADDFFISKNVDVTKVEKPLILVT